MSRERRERQREQGKLSTFELTLTNVARGEGRRIDTASTRDSFVHELMERGALVDMGPHPSGGGRKLSFRFDKIQGQADYSTIEELFEGVFGRKANE